MKTFDAHTSPSSSPAGRCVVRHLEGRSQLSSFWLLLQFHLPSRPQPSKKRSLFQRLLAASPSLPEVAGPLLWPVRRHECPGYRDARRGRYSNSSHQRRALYHSLSNKYTGLPNPHRRGNGFCNSNFTHPAALIMQSCPSSSTCNASGNFSAMSLIAGAPTTVIAAPGISNQTVTAGLAIFLPDNNGAASFTGVDTARISLTATDRQTTKTLPPLKFVWIRQLAKLSKPPCASLWRPRPAD